jgi:hypothetical protein
MSGAVHVHADLTPDGAFVLDRGVAHCHDAGVSSESIQGESAERLTDPGNAPEFQEVLMRGFSNVKRRQHSPIRIAVAATAGVLLLTAALVPASMLAAAPTPAEGSATVDGNIGDWSLGTDFFADMNDGVDGHPVRAKFYAKYDCDAEVLYGLVLVQGDEKARQDRPDEAYINIDGSNEVDSNSGAFAWVNGDGTLADGFEGSTDLAPGDYTLRVHILVADDSADGYTPMDLIGRNVPLVIECAGVAPTQGTPTPTPQTPNNPTPKPPSGGVAPTTGTRPVNTLPPTDTLDQSATSGPGGAGLVLLFLGLGSFVSLVATRGRRRPAAIEVKESIDRR